MYKRQLIPYAVYLWILPRGKAGGKADRGLTSAWFFLFVLANLFEDVAEAFFWNEFEASFNFIAKRPLIYLSIAGVVNVLLNLFFVIVCHMAAAGVATASAISLYISASLVMIHLLRRTDDCKVSLRKIRLHPKACKAVLMLGIPTGLQNGIFAIANLFVQTGVNSFDAVSYTHLDVYKRQTLLCQNSDLGI